MSRLWINSRRQHELLPPLFDYSLVDEQHGRQVGGGPPTGLTQPTSELLHPGPHRNVRSLNANPAKNARDLAGTHTETVQQDCQLDDLAICPLTLGKLNLVQHFTQLGKVHENQLQ
jgi:hypothetical protein